MAIRKTAAAAKAEETKATAVKTEEKAETADKTATKAAPKTTAAKTTAAKTTATKTAAKTATKAAAAKTEEKAAPAKKTTAKKAAAKETVTKVYIEYNGAKVSVDEMIENVKLTYKGNGSSADIETLEVYVKPEENAAYFVVNGELEGNKMDVYFC